MLDEAQELALIRSVLTDAFPHESRRVGRTNLNDIVRRRGQVRITPMSGASRLEWTDALNLLATSALLVSQWLIDCRRAGCSIHFRQENHVRQEVRIGRVEQESHVTVTSPIEFAVPTELEGRLDPATLNRLIAALTRYVDTPGTNGSDTHEPA